MNLASRIESHLPPNRFHLLRKIADEATTRGLTCYAVGGFARDLLLDRLIHDLDLVFESDAISFARALARSHGGRVTAHPQFHTAIWHLPQEYIGEGQPDFIDFITARSETYASPGALPSVTPSNIDDDLHRRDLTINAMAVRLDGRHYGELIDLLDGRADLERGLIKILHPNSFMDDPTRIFRAVRYEQRYGFKMDPPTEARIDTDALRVLSTLSGERLRHELDLMLKEEHRAGMIFRIGNLGVLETVHPYLAKGEVSALERLASLPREIEADVVSVGYAMWMMNLPMQAIQEICERLKFHASTARIVAAASQLHSALPAMNASKPSEWTFALEGFAAEAVLAVYLAGGKAELLNYLKKWRYIRPLTTGDVLRRKGIPPGPRYKEILNQLRAAWLDGVVTSEAEERKLLETYS